MKPEINKYIEIVQVLLYLSDCQDKVEQVITNKEYCGAIEEHFSSFRKHEAVIKTRELILNSNFIHIKPLRAVLQLDKLLSNDCNELHSWALSVAKFIDDTNYEFFFAKQTGYYNRILSSIASCDFNVWIDYIEKYFRQKPTEFKLIICPLNGNYGFNLNYQNENTSYAVRFYDGNGNKAGDFSLLAKGIAHEYAHCFINPIVEGNKELLVNYKPFFARHTNMLKYYNVDYAIINEYWVRAFAIRFMEENVGRFPAFDINAEYDRQRQIFLYIDKFIDMLKNFEKEDVAFNDFYLHNIDTILILD